MVERLLDLGHRAPVERGVMDATYSRLFAFTFVLLLGLRFPRVQETWVICCLVSLGILERAIKIPDTWAFPMILFSRDLLD